MRSRWSEPRLGTLLLYSISPSNPSFLSLLPLSFSRPRIHRLLSLLSSRISLASLAQRLGSFPFHRTRRESLGCRGSFSGAERFQFRRYRGGNLWDWGDIGRRWSCGLKSKGLIRVLVVDGVSRSLGEDSFDGADLSVVMLDSGTSLLETPLFQLGVQAGLILLGAG